MVRAGVSVGLLVALQALAFAQGAPQPDAPPTPVPPVPPTEQPPPSPVPSAYERCRELRRKISSDAEATSDLRERTRLLQSMPQCSPDMVDVPAPTSPPPVEAPSGDMADEVAATGFALEVRLETAQAFAGSSSVLPATQAGIFVGHHSRSITIGVGFDFGRVTTSSDDPVAGSTSQSSNLVLVMPGLRAVLAHSHDGRTEMLAQIDAGYGVNWSSSDPDPDPDSPSTGHFRVQAAPGIRYWVAPSFAVGATTGLRYDRFGREDTTGTASMSASLTALFGSFQLTGVF